VLTAARQVRKKDNFSGLTKYEADTVLRLRWRKHRVS